MAEHPQRYGNRTEREQPPDPGDAAGREDSPPPDPRHALGRRGERLAAEHLERLGYRIVARNHRTRFGEIDLVAADDETIVFCEVKTRRAGSGAPWDALDERKRKQVRSMGAAWLCETHERPRTAELRFDAIGVILDAHGALVDLVHLEGAF